MQKVIFMLHVKPILPPPWIAYPHIERYSIYLSKNGIWLTKRVPVEYLEKEM